MDMELLKSGYKRKYYKHTYTLPAGEIAYPVTVNSSGILEGMIINTTSEKVKIICKVDGETNEMRIDEMLTLGLRKPNGVSPHLEKYDAINNSYTVCWYPVPETVWVQQFKVSIKNEDTAEATVNILCWVWEQL